MAKAKEAKAEKVKGPVVTGLTHRLMIGEVFIRETDQGMQITEFVSKKEVGVALIPEDIYALLTE